MAMSHIHTVNRMMVSRMTQQTFQRNGHKRSQCPMLSAHGSHKTAAVQQMKCEPPGRKFSPHQCNDSRGIMYANWRSCKEVSDSNCGPWQSILHWYGKSIVHGHTSPRLNCWQHTRFSWPRHRHKATRCQIYITVYHRYTAERRQSGETVPETDKTPENKENQM